MNEIPKPCPFCGTRNPCVERCYIGDGREDSGWRALDAYDVTCLNKDCGAVIEMPGDASVAIAAWNNRSLEATAEARGIEKGREQVAAWHDEQEAFLNTYNRAPLADHADYAASIRAGKLAVN